LFYQEIPGSEPDSDGFYTFPCDSTLPEISFQFNGQNFPMTQGFNQGPDYEDSTRCIGGIRALGDTPLWILEDAFMINYYTVFNFGDLQAQNAQVGFATLA
jgi:hypothetical protein